jgi:hypothetical protein
MLRPVFHTGVQVFTLVRLEALTVVTMKVTLFWFATLRSRFKGTSWLHLLS